MLIGMVRPRESKTFEVRGEEFTDIDATVAEQTPTGWERTAAPVTMSKNETILTAAVTLSRRDGVEEIEAEDMDALRAKVPTGHQLLSVREV